MHGAFTNFMQVPAASCLCARTILHPQDAFLGNAVEGSMHILGWLSSFKHGGLLHLLVRDGQM